MDDSTPATFDSGLQPPHADLALEYLTIARSLKTRTAWSAVKGHLFKLLRPGLLLPENHDLRDKLGKTSKDAWTVAEDICTELKKRMDADALAKAHLTPAQLTQYAPVEPNAEDVDNGANAEEVDPHLTIYAASRKTIPHWLAQPHWRANASAKPKVKNADKPAMNGSSKAAASSMAETGTSTSGKPHGGSGKPTTTLDQPDIVASVEEVVTSALNKADHAITDKAEQFTASLATADMAVDAGDVAVIPDASCPASGSAGSGVSAPAPLSTTASRTLDPFDDLVPRSAPAAGRDSGSSIAKRTRDTRTPELTDAGDGAKRPKREDDVAVKPPLTVALA